MNQLFQLVVSGAGSLTDVAGNLLDGDSNGTPGGDMGLVFGRGTQLSFVDPDGDVVLVRLSGGGYVDLSQRTGQEKSLIVVGHRTGRSVVTGRVTQRPGGDGVTRLHAINSPTGFVNRLPPSFQVGDQALAAAVDSLLVSGELRASHLHSGS